MVDVTEKGITDRTAVAEGRIVMAPATVNTIRGGTGSKGDVLGVAELAGIMAGKRTGELIPLCHHLPAVSLSVQLEVDDELPGVSARATARVAPRRYWFWLGA